MTDLVGQVARVILSTPGEYSPGVDFDGVSPSSDLAGFHHFWIEHAPP